MKYFIFILLFLILLTTQSYNPKQNGVVTYANKSSRQIIVSKCKLYYLNNKKCKLVFIPFCGEKSLSVLMNINRDTILTNREFFISPDRLKKIGIDPPIYLTSVFGIKKDTIYCNVFDSKERLFRDTLLIIN